MRSLSMAKELLQTETVCQWFLGMQGAVSETDNKLVALYELRENIVEAFRACPDGCHIPEEQ